MKKLLIAVTTLVLTLVLVACTGSNANLQDAWDRLQLDVSDLNSVTGTVELPTDLAHGSKATWTSSNAANAAVVERRGSTYAVIEQPLHSEGIKEAKLTATIKLGSATLIKDFEIKIPVLPENLVELESIAALRQLQIGGKDQPATLPARLENAVVVGLDQDAYYVTDGTDVTLVFTAPVGLAVGDKGTVVGDAAIYYDAYQLANASFVVKEIDKVVTAKAVELSKYNYLSANAAKIKTAKSSSDLLQLVKFTALVVLRPDFTGGANYTTTLVGKNANGQYDLDANFVLSYYKHDNHAEIAKYNGQEVEITATVRELRDSRALTVGVSKPVFSLSIQTIGTATPIQTAHKELIDSVFTINTNYQASAALVLPTEGKSFKTAINWALVDASDASLINLTAKTVTAQTGVRKGVKLTATIGSITKEFTVYVGEYLNKTVNEFKAVTDLKDVYVVTGVVTSNLATADTGTATYTIADATGSVAVRIPEKSRKDLKVGDKITVTGSKVVFSGVIQVDSVLSVVVDGTLPVPAAIVANNLTFAELTENQSALVVYNSVKVTEVFVDSYKNITLSFEGTTSQIKWDSRIKLSSELETALKAVKKDDIISISAIVASTSTDKNDNTIKWHVLSFSAVSTITK